MGVWVCVRDFCFQLFLKSLTYLCRIYANLGNKYLGTKIYDNPRKKHQTNLSQQKMDKETEEVLAQTQAIDTDANAEVITVMDLTIDQSEDDATVAEEAVLAHAQAIDTDADVDEITVVDLTTDREAEAVMAQSRANDTDADVNEITVVDLTTDQATYPTLFDAFLTCSFLTIDQETRATDTDADVNEITVVDLTTEREAEVVLVQPRAKDTTDADVKEKTVVDLTMDQSKSDEDYATEAEAVLSQRQVNDTEADVDEVEVEVINIDSNENDELHSPPPLASPLQQSPQLPLLTPSLLPSSPTQSPSSPSQSPSSPSTLPPSRSPSSLPPLPPPRPLPSLARCIWCLETEANIAFIHRAFQQRDAHLVFCEDCYPDWVKRRLQQQPSDFQTEINWNLDQCPISCPLCNRNCDGRITLIRGNGYCITCKVAPSTWTFLDCGHVTFCRGCLYEWYNEQLLLQKQTKIGILLWNNRNKHLPICPLCGPDGPIPEAVVEVF